MIIKILLCLAAILATIAFIILMTKNQNDAAAREQVQQESDRLLLVNNKINEVLIREQSIVLQKNISNDMVVEYEAVKALTLETTNTLLLIDTLDSLAVSVNMTIEELAQVYLTQIADLELALKVEVGTANVSSVTTIQNGTCMLGGTQITYSYKKVLDYYYYVFGVTGGDVAINQNFAINGCTPPIYEGPVGEASPIYAAQLSKMSGVESIVTGLRAGNNQLVFETVAFGGTMNVAINEPLTHFVSFF